MHLHAVAMETSTVALLLLTLLAVTGTAAATGESSCAVNAASAQFQPLDPSCYSRDNATNPDTNWQVSPDLLTCALLCARRDTCKFLNFTSGRCAVSERPQRMTHRKLDARFSRCREVCVNSRRFCVVQERLVDAVNFSRSWLDYENGFGEPGAFWIGLRLLSLITAQSSSLIFRAEMRDWNNSMFAAEYTGFVVQNASANYAMNYTRFLNETSNVNGDSLVVSRGAQFSTLDRDNDAWPNSCSTQYHGGAGWWFGSCTNANPNGLMTTEEVATTTSVIHWKAVHGNKNSLKSMRLLLELLD